ncbi:TonB-dependent receptor [Opitutus sp. ER46]|uniref:TonB-dependent receptor n=1 Tax=Opitutus sp. ER46 TaxID=2161864 RepID=UPI000D316C90|nr:TonB-dependent receptor [Opitutus sp. ER46]PTX92519.1 hypothetical protein DB354_14405 [Opitutus sp. ER46]
MHTPKNWFSSPLRLCRWTLWLLLPAWCSLALAAGARQNFNLPAGDAVRTLRQFTEQSGEQIVYPIDLVRGIQTNAVSGERTAREALDAMLSGTGLAVVQDQTNGALAVTKAGPAAAPETSPAAGPRPPRANPAAQPVGEDVVKLDTYIVNGMTAAMAKAQQIKRDSGQVVEAIVADDVNKLPDLSVTEALQRVTGISITRELGEGATVALRGLTDVTATLNGQEVFSPQVVTGEARVMNLQTVPSEMISAINVIKTPTADMIEGGIAGTIDIRLRRPLDFDGKLNGSLTTRMEYSEGAESSKFQYSGVLTDTWKVGHGKLGALATYTKQERDIRQDLNSTGKPVIFNAPTNPVVGSDGSYEPRIVANRQREGASAVLQWEPFSGLRMFAEYDYSEQVTIQDSFAPTYNTPTTLATRLGDAVSVYSGATVMADHDGNAATPLVALPVVKSIHVLNSSFSSTSTTRDWTERTHQFTAGATWRRDRLTLQAELARMQSRSDFDNMGAAASVSGISYTLNTDRDIPSAIADDPSLLTVKNIANWNWAYWYYNYIVNKNDSTTASFDLTQRLDSNGFFRRLKFGARGSDRNGRNHRISASGAFASSKVSDYPALYRPATVTGFFDGEAGKINDYVEIATGPMRGYAKFMNLIGGNPTLPAPSPGNLFDITERTWAAYGMTDFGMRAPVPFDGNVGVRVIGTNVTSDGYRRLNNVWSTIVEKGEYVDVLPSLNTRWFLQDDFFLRLSVSKQLSRQSFGKLNPNVRLTPPTVAGARGTGTAGNPDLKPLRTQQFDVSLEKYFNESTSLYVSGYYKKIDGYTQTGVTVENWDGIEYDISRPYAVDDATVKGVEVGYQQFFSFLPGPFSGLGLLANYTYVDARNPSGDSLTNLSKNGYNVILMYEKYGWTARLAYNWRDEFSRSTGTATALGSTTIYDPAFGWLDGSLSYKVNAHLKLSFDVSNALRTKRTSYWQEKLLQHEDVLEDRQFYLSATWSL